jgi:quercetin dioxygenase-like cupin family protein
MTTTPSHYEIQKARRDAFLDDWRQHRQTVVRAGDAVPVDLAAGGPGQRALGYMGEAAGRPTRFLDAMRVELDAGTTTDRGARSWDAVHLVLSGTGTAVIGDRRHELRPWDAFHTPAFVPFHLQAEGDLVLMAFSSFPLVHQLGAARVLPPGALLAADTPSGAAPPLSPAVHVDAARAADADRLGARTFTDYDHEPLRLNPKGTRSKFMVDPSIGYRTSGLTMVMTQYGPGAGQVMHCHPGEAFLLVIEGQGETYIGEDPESGTWYPWSAGDVVVVDHFVWHQHWNRSDERPARLLRVHMMETMLTSMRAVLDPLELLLEPEEMFRRHPDPSGIAWPDDRRPG